MKLLDKILKFFGLQRIAPPSEFIVLKPRTLETNYLTIERVVSKKLEHSVDYRRHMDREAAEKFVTNIIKNNLMDIEKIEDPYLFADLRFRYTMRVLK